MAVLDLDNRILQRRKLWRRISRSTGIHLGGGLLALIAAIALLAPCSRRMIRSRRI